MTCGITRDDYLFYLQLLGLNDEPDLVLLEVLVEFDLRQRRVVRVALQALEREAAVLPAASGACVLFSVEWMRVCVHVCVRVCLSREYADVTHCARTRTERTCIGLRRKSTHTQ